MNADFIIADSEATFQHGNLVRGVCPLGLLSQTLVDRVGSGRTLRMYLTDETLDAQAALNAGLARHWLKGWSHRSATHPSAAYRTESGGRP